MKNLIYVSVILSLFFSCKKKNTETINSPDPVTGSIAGKTTQYSQTGLILTENLNKVTVSLDNDPAITSTDEAGNYTLSGVKQGIYTIFFSKPGCSTYQIQQVIFPGNGTILKNGVLIDSPTFSFSSASISVTDTVNNNYQTSLYFTVYLSPQPIQVMGTVYFGYTPEVGSNNYSYYINFTVPAFNSKITFTKVIPLQGNNVTLFAKIYPYAGYAYSYFDNASNSNVYLGLGTALPTIKI